MYNKKEVENLRNIYTEGTRIKLISMSDPYPIPEGTIGTVRYVDDMCQIQMRWDNGNSLALIPNEDDFIIVKEAI